MRTFLNIRSVVIDPSVSMTHANNKRLDTEFRNHYHYIIHTLTISNKNQNSVPTKIFMNDSTTHHGRTRDFRQPPRVTYQHYADVPNSISKGLERKELFFFPSRSFCTAGGLQSIVLVRTASSVYKQKLHVK
jgi:hypothetical protein